MEDIYKSDEPLFTSCRMEPVDNGPSWGCLIALVSCILIDALLLAIVLSYY